MYDLDDKNSLSDLYKDWLDLAGGDSIDGRKALSLLLADNKITGWHASRVISIDEITSQGLLAYTSDQGLQRMMGLCNKIGFNESDKDAVMSAAKRYLKKCSKVKPCLLLRIRKHGRSIFKVRRNIWWRDV